MKKFLRQVIKQACKDPRRIVLPEGEEERIIRAAAVISKRGIAQLTLLGDRRKILNKAQALKVKLNPDKITFINPKRSKLLTKFATEFYQLRKHKGVTLKEAQETVKNINYFGTMMVQLNYADGMVTGTLESTADSIRPALQIIKTREKFHKVSGIFFMILEKRLLLFADTAITVDPNSHDLVDIAIDTAETAQKFGITPKVALLSFSTEGSADHPVVAKVQEAVAMLKAQRPDIIADGEMQVDAALVPSVAKHKSPKSAIQGDANILIFPNLESANIAYKLVERLAKAEAIGPLLQGLRKPVNDLSRGCDFEDIIHVTAFTVCECQTS